jgi:hypothetical protein
MRVIEGLDEAIAGLREKLPGIDEHFEKVNAEFIALTTREHDVIGRVLRTHLIVEYYVREFVERHYGFEDMEALKLRFATMAEMLPTKNHGAAYIRPGIIALNTIRNKIAHRLDFEIQHKHIEPIWEIVKTVRPNAEFNGHIDVIEGFTPIVCFWLGVTPTMIDKGLLSMKKKKPINE